MKKIKWAMAAVVAALAWTIGVELWEAGPLDGPRRQQKIDVRHSGNVVNAVKLQAEPERQRVPSSAPVKVTFKLVNLSDSSRSIEILQKSSTPMGIYVVVRHADGRLATLTELGNEVFVDYIDDRPYMARLFRAGLPTFATRIPSQKSYFLSGGGSRRSEIEVSKYYDMSQPDTYTVESEALLITNNNDGVVGGYVVGNVVQVEVE